MQEGAGEWEWEEEGGQKKTKLNRGQVPLNAFRYDPVLGLMNMHDNIYAISGMKNRAGQYTKLPEKQFLCGCVEI